MQIVYVLVVTFASLRRLVPAPDIAFKTNRRESEYGTRYNLGHDDGAFGTGLGHR